MMRRRLSAPLALLAGFILALALARLAVALGLILCGAGIVLAARATRPRRRRPATRRASRDIPAIVRARAERWEPPGGMGPIVQDAPWSGPGGAGTPELREQVAKADPADRPLTQISPDDPDAAEAVRRALSRRGARLGQRVDPPAPGPEREP
jgi:hypothetical protein